MRLELTVAVFGSKNRRVDVEMRPTIPFAIVGHGKAVTKWAEELCQVLSQDLKYTRKWGCYVCGEPAREIELETTDYVQLSPPKFTLCVHHLCKTGNGACHKQVRAQNLMLRMLALDFRHPPMRILERPGPSTLPLARNCAYCHSLKPKMKIKRCGSCQLTRYCSVDCQRADWARHKTMCKMVTVVKRVN